MMYELRNKRLDLRHSYRPVLVVRRPALLIQVIMELWYARVPHRPSRHITQRSAAHPGTEECAALR